MEQPVPGPQPEFAADVATSGLDCQSFFFAWDHDQGRWRKALVSDTCWDAASRRLSINFVNDEYYAADFIVRHWLAHWEQGDAN